jgi:hypothetical protein
MRACAPCQGIASKLFFPCVISWIFWT